MAAAKLNNPTTPEFRGMDYQQSARTTRVLGQMSVVVQPTTNPRYVVDPCCAGAAAPAPAPAPCDLPGSITLIGESEFIYSPTPNSSYIYGYDISWVPVSNASSYEISLFDTSEAVPMFDFTTVEISGPTYISIYFNGDYEHTLATITAINDCGTSFLPVPLNPCFLAGSLVQMADGSVKPIEEILVGDLVLGAYGEINEVLALHRPTLGSAQMCRINGEHSSTSHHPHVSVDRGFYCMHPSVVETTTYGREHEVINAAGEKELRMLHGLAAGRVRELITGVELKVVSGGRIVESLELYDLPADTQLYNLVVGGSHTYHVDGYAVTGWPREDDFDYDTWTVRA